MPNDGFRQGKGQAKGIRSTELLLTSTDIKKNRRRAIYRKVLESESFMEKSMFNAMKEKRSSAFGLRSRSKGAVGAVGSLFLIVMIAMSWLLIPGSPRADSSVSHTHISPSVLKDGSPLPTPTGSVILTVNGALNGNPGEPIRFDIAGLEQFGLIRYTSKNRWYSNPVTYEGVKGSVFLSRIGVPKGVTRLKLRALNDYVVYIPISDFHSWPVMLALKLDGRYMSVREKGPIWVVYPNHIHPELMAPTHQGKWIWQLAEITIE